METTLKAKVRTKDSAIGRIALLLVLGAMLAGCDKCGNWWSPMGGDPQSEAQVCREQSPRPQ